MTRTYSFDPSSPCSSAPHQQNLSRLGNTPYPSVCSSSLTPCAHTKFPHVPLPLSTIPAVSARESEWLPMTIVDVASPVGVSAHTLVITDVGYEVRKSTTAIVGAPTLADDAASSSVLPTE